MFICVCAYSSIFLWVSHVCNVLKEGREVVWSYETRVAGSFGKQKMGTVNQTGVPDPTTEQQVLLISAIFLQPWTISMSFQCILGYGFWFYRNLPLDTRNSSDTVLRKMGESVFGTIQEIALEKKPVWQEIRVYMCHSKWSLKKVSCGVQSQSKDQGMRFWEGIIQEGQSE